MCVTPQQVFRAVTYQQQRKKKTTKGTTDNAVWPWSVTQQYSPIPTHTEQV